MHYSVHFRSLPGGDYFPILDSVTLLCSFYFKNFVFKQKKVRSISGMEDATPNTMLYEGIQVLDLLNQILDDEEKQCNGM